MNYIDTAEMFAEMMRAKSRSEMFQVVSDSLPKILRHALEEQRKEQIEKVKSVIDQKRAILWHPDIKKHTQRIARENTLNEMEADILSALELE